MPEIEDWLNEDFIKINKLDKWNASIQSLHSSKEKLDINSNSFRRLVFDELCANFLSLSENRRRFRKTKNPKNFNTEKSEVLIKNLPFKLTSSQIKVLNEINIDLLSNKRMFRILQGDVGSGKTIVSLISIKNVVESGYQCAIMTPTEILAKQHFNLSKKIFKNNKIKIEFLTGKTKPAARKKILGDLQNGKIDFLVGTHTLFQKKINIQW